jgi:hypothetical protein
MLTYSQRAAVAAYHWWSSFFECVGDAREVWLISTHRPTKLITYTQEGLLT